MPRLALRPLIALAVLIAVAAAVAAGRPRVAAPADRLLPAPDDRVVRRVVAKGEVTAALLRGDLTLTGAAARFRDLNGDDPRPLAVFRRWFPDAGEDELACRQALQFAAVDPRATAARRAARLPELVAEFRARFPDAPPLGWAGGAAGPHP